jgi:hypothetical protein
MCRAPLAQLDRASGYEPEGREFESLRAHHLLLGFSQSTARQARQVLPRFYRPAALLGILGR